MKYCFVILHYLFDDITIKCIESIISNYSSYQYDIVVVNNDLDLRANKLRTIYRNNKRINIISTNEQMSFSIANNIGYAYAKKLVPDYIIMANNDIEFIDVDFLNTIDNLYNKHKYLLLGPNILDKKGKSTSPLSIGKPSILDMFENICKIAIKNTILYDTIAKLFHFISKRSISVLEKGNINGELLNENEFDVVLLGACLIYSKKFINKYNNAFYPMKNFYGEERILKLILDNNNEISMYSPQLFVFHNYGLTTKKVIKKLDRFKKKNNISSMFTYMVLYLRKETKI